MDIVMALIQIVGGFLAFILSVALIIVPFSILSALKRIEAKLDKMDKNRREEFEAFADAFNERA